MWDAVEADFLRDYNINLMEQIDTMSWRRFLVLLHNLNPHGAVAYRSEAARNENKKKREKENLSTKAASDSFFNALLSI